MGINQRLPPNQRFSEPGPLRWACHVHWVWPHAARVRGQRVTAQREEQSSRREHACRSLWAGGRSPRAHESLAPGVRPLLGPRPASVKPREQSARVARTSAWAEELERSAKARDAHPSPVAGEETAGSVQLGSTFLEQGRVKLPDGQQTKPERANVRRLALSRASPWSGRRARTPRSG